MGKRCLLSITNLALIVMTLATTAAKPLSHDEYLEKLSLNSTERLAFLKQYPGTVMIACSDRGGRKVFCSSDTQYCDVITSSCEDCAVLCPEHRLLDDTTFLDCAMKCRGKLRPNIVFTFQQRFFQHLFA